jgi:cell division septation protein DedD
MTSQLRPFAAPSLALMFLLSACVSSEEAGTDKRAESTQASTDSARLLAQADSQARADSLRGKRGRFTSKQDTVTASIVKRSKFSARAIKPVHRPANAAYTVQIGAFVRTMHALRAQKLAKERFADLPISNSFEPFDKLYRVSVGKFDERSQANSLRKSMIKQFPQDYLDSWINYVSK